jgi:ABC-type glycerol-3-phosphate transport system permease component
MRTDRRSRFAASSAKLLGALLLLSFVLAPFAMTLLASLTPDRALLSRPARWFSQGLTFDNYRYLFTGELPSQYQVSAGGRSFSMVSEEILHLLTSMLHSAEVAVVVMIINLLLGSMAAYALARLRFAGKKLVFNFIVGTRLIPAVALAVPFYGLMQTMKLINNLLSLVLIYTALTLPFTILLLVASFRRIDRAIEEAAQIDGLNPGQVLLRIVVPLTKPALVGTALFSFMLSYSEFLFGLLLTTNSDSRTLPVTLASVSVNPDVSLGLITAGVIVGVLPTLLVIVPIWRFMIRGLAEGATKS